jgi:hypothetical protein
MNWLEIGLRPTRLVVVVVYILCATYASARDFSVGVYYYPGWSPYIKGLREPDPWWPIKLYPEREPLVGWYDDAQPATLDRQLGLMADYGIDFVIFDWYWENGRPAPETSVGAYLKSPERAVVRYALLWANHNKEPRTLQEWDALVDYWIAHHLGSREYVHLDDKPVVFIFSADSIRDRAKDIGKSVIEMLDRARNKAKAAGLPGIYFVLCVPATDYWVVNFAPKSGFDALSAYNYHFGLAGDGEKQTPYSHSFAELDSDYQMQWQWILKNSKLPYFVPMTSGWDKRPWGGSRTDPLHDNSMSTPDSFERHLLAARNILTTYPEKTRGIGMVCCWNEYGEGTYIEPTKRYGFEYLKRIKKVFGARN